MKFKKLRRKFEKLINKNKRGKSISSKKLSLLKNLLKDKKLRYDAKLENEIDADKKQSFEIKRKVVIAQLEKVEQLVLDND